MDFRRVVFHCIVFLLPKQIKICNKIVEGFLLCTGRKCINASAYEISMDLLIVLDPRKKDWNPFNEPNVSEESERRNEWVAHVGMYST